MSANLMDHWAHMQTLLPLRSCFLPLPLFRRNAHAKHFTWKWLDFQENECPGDMHFHMNCLAQRLVLLEAKVNYSSMSCSGSLWFLLGVTSLFSGREQIIRDLGLCQIILICIVWCHFLAISMTSVAGVKLYRKARNFRWNPATHTIASKAKKPASPADVTSAFAPDLLLRCREPEHLNFKHS